LPAGTKPASSPLGSRAVPLVESQYTVPASVSSDPAAGASARRSLAMASAAERIGVSEQDAASFASDASNFARADFAPSVRSHASSSKVAC